MTNINTMHLNKATINAAIFWMVVLCSALFITAPAKAADDLVVAAVVESNPYYGANQQYVEYCKPGTHKCWLVPMPAEWFATTFTNGREQFTILTKAQFPHDIWFDITRNCDTGECKYKSAILSSYQSSETLAIQEILQREQQKYLQNPNRLY